MKREQPNNWIYVNVSPRKKSTHALSTVDAILNCILSAQRTRNSTAVFLRHKNMQCLSLLKLDNSRKYRHNSSGVNVTV